MNTPQHPASQQGLGAPQSPQPQNEYYQPSAALQGYNGQLQAAQAQQARAAAEKAQAETAVLQQSQGLGMTPNASQMQAESIASNLLAGTMPKEQVIGMMYKGEIPQEIGAAAIQMADQQVMPQQGLGGL